MAEEVLDYYILFHDHTEGMALYSYLKSRDLHPRICPVPRSLSECCGMALLLTEDEAEDAQRRTEESGIGNLGIRAIPHSVDAHRDRYC